MVLTLPLTSQLSELLSSNMSSLTPKPQFMIPLFPLPSPGDSSDPTGFSSDAAINNMSSPGRPQPPTAAKPAWKSLCRNQIKPEPVQTNRFDSVCLQDVQGNKRHAKRHHGGLISKIQTLQNYRTCNLVHSTNISLENEKD